MGTPIIEYGYVSTQNEMDIFISNKSGTAEVYLLPLYITGAEGFLFCKLVQIIIGLSYFAGQQRINKVMILY